jgi:hypothetical protein
MPLTVWVIADADNLPFELIIDLIQVHLIENKHPPSLQIHFFPNPLLPQSPTSKP